MGKIKIITDSTCDLNLEIIRKYDIEVIPLIVNFGEESYLDGVDMNFHSLLHKINKDGSFPTTSQINPQRFFECYKKYLEEGYKIISLHLSSKMSGTYQSACIAKEMLESEDIEIIDTQNVTSGLGILVILASLLKEQGKNLDEIVDTVKSGKEHVKSMLSFNSLDHLVKGGRLSKTAGFLGNMLGIKLMLCVKDGEMAVVEKIRGNKKALKYTMDYLEEINVKPGTPVILLNASSEDMYDALKERLNEKNIEFVECEVGCVVGTHSGPNAAGIFFIENY
ncbi:DegV family protein [Clostridium hydrogeniformans]|uniref:DegV family protein n=1 Tax=Clostridium hydrogeniformans TaxID=349933 RepID=UPI00047F1E18|nr:DegV family protein [Clostridium hydrogeniformans]